MDGGPHFRLPALTPLIAGIFAVALAAAPAAAVDIGSLAGWWIAIDDTFPQLWQRGELAPAEEVLIINGDGRAENRLMNFWSGDPESCARTKVCSDLPVIASARLRIHGDSLMIGERKAPGERIDSARSDGRIRQVAVTAIATWTLTQSGGVMTLRSGNTARIFARIEPDRLRRLRAGMRISGLPPAQHWRCFLAIGTAHNAAFASLRSGPVAAPDFLEPYLKAASYVVALDALLRKPTADDRDLKARDLIAYEPEQLMTEEFEGLAVPARLSDKQRLQAQAAAIAQRARPKAADDAGDDASALALNAPRIGLGNAEIGALARAASDEPAARKMFCRE